MISQIRSLFERCQQTTRSPGFISMSVPNVRLAATKTTDAVPGTPADAPNLGPAKGMRNFRKIDNLEKRFLVWTGKYKTLAEVPESVSFDVFEKARNKVRIRLANFMIVLTVVGCVAFALSGKKAAKRGESVQKMNLDWHKQINEEGKAEK